MGYVVDIEGSDGTHREYYLIDGETTVGRDPSNALLLEGRGVSRRHAKFVLTTDRLVIADLGSTYGTRVNGVTTLRRELTPGDEITIGTHILRLQSVSDTEQQPVVDAATDAWPDGYSAYSSDEVTQNPDELELANMRTQEMSRSAIQYVLDNWEDVGKSAQVMPSHDSDLISAMKRMGSTASAPAPTTSTTASPEVTEYQALLLMYKVSQLLAGSTDLLGFSTAVADLVLEEVRADTVVLLITNEKEELVPQIIRHRGSLNPGEIPISRGIVDRVATEHVIIMSNDVGQDSRIKAGQSVMLYKIQAVCALPLMVEDEFQGVLYVGRSMGHGFTEEDGDLLRALVSLISSGIGRATLKERIAAEKQQRKALERFHPPEIVDRLFIQEAGQVSLEEHNATVLICDLQGFSGMVHRVPPRQLAAVLHEYYELLYEKVFANGGSLVKLHDGWALALFGAPHSQDRDAAWAVEAALDICEEFESLAVLWPQSQAMACRCVIDTGMVVAGIVGSIERMEYTAIGLPITTASLLVQKIQGTAIWITDRTWSELPRARHRVQELPPLAEVNVYRLQR